MTAPQPPKPVPCLVGRDAVGREPWQRLLALVRGLAEMKRKGRT